MSENDDQYGAAETKRRMEAGLRRALTTPHKPNQAFVGKKRKSDSAKGRKRRKKA